MIDAPITAPVDHTQIYLAAIGALVVLIPVVLKFLTDRKIEAVKHTVGTLATNIDGAMVELKNNIAGKNLAVGHAEGLAEGRLASSDERQVRVAEGERVEDRAAQIAVAANKKT